MKEGGQRVQKGCLFVSGDAKKQQHIGYAIRPFQYNLLLQGTDRLNFKHFALENENLFLELHDTLYRNIHAVAASLYVWPSLVVLLL